MQGNSYNEIQVSPNIRVFQRLELCPKHWIYATARRSSQSVVNMDKGERNAEAINVRLSISGRTKLTILATVDLDLLITQAPSSPQHKRGSASREFIRDS